ncbi:DUF1054 domain-containing protein [Sporosarcina sp. Sa2YVA2]|uniref:UPF0637 protein H9649_02275 n=1 Tax=Sporosarcina quadrami TaxID=2762234 RepID=A0ABR8U5S9_9BACL|nr:DUF1054 domain-containing protein [Sporosarcina quadrami]MBD7983393.1 DUF1054 domain-containing protein [Sporosarcina quadrami]
MPQSFWDSNDFAVFSIDGLDQRMEALQKLIQPKFAVSGEHISSYLSSLGKGEFFPHIARHARRTVNPPKDSWVAFAPAKRGYKALPHFQIGLWGTHLFVILAVIYENPDKKGIAERLEKNSKVFTTLSEDFVISGDHMKPEASYISKIGQDGVAVLLERLKTVKKAELVIGKHVTPEYAVSMTDTEFLKFAEQTIDELLPVYNVITG